MALFLFHDFFGDVDSQNEPGRTPFQRPGVYLAHFLYLAVVFWVSTIINHLRGCIQGVLKIKKIYYEVIDFLHVTVLRHYLMSIKHISIVGFPVKFLNIKEIFEITDSSICL